MKILKSLRFFTALWILVASISGLQFRVPSAAAVEASPFVSLAGRWTGEGRLGLQDSPPETVKCRATYFITDGKDELKQNIRCATAGGNIEVQSAIQNAGGQLTGTWKETTHNIEGELTGQVTPNGFRITVKSSDLAANMDIIVKADKQIVEIQFFNSALLGLSMIMTKG
jgi:hypothetical protein